MPARPCDCTTKGVRQATHHTSNAPLKDPVANRRSSNDDPLNVPHLNPSVFSYCGRTVCGEVMWVNGEAKARRTGEPLGAPHSCPASSLLRRCFSFARQVVFDRGALPTLNHQEPKNEQTGSRYACVEIAIHDAPHRLTFASVSILPPASLHISRAPVPRAFWPNTAKRALRGIHLAPNTV